VIVDPVTRVSWAIKAGSSLYFGIGEVDGVPFSLASSDLTAVLRFTKMLVNLREGEFVEYTHDYYQIYAQKDLRFKHLNQQDEVYAKGGAISTRPVYSKLRAEDVELLPEHEFFMEQEIYAQVESTGKLIKLFAGGSNTGKRMLQLTRKEGIHEMLKEQIPLLVDAPDLAGKLSALMRSASPPNGSSSIRSPGTAIRKSLTWPSRKILTRNTSSPMKKTSL